MRARPITGRSEDAFDDGLAHGLVGGLGTALQGHGEPDAGVAAGGDHGVRVVGRERHRLLDQDVFAGAGGGDGLGGVRSARRADADGVHVGAGQERFVARLARDAELRGGRRRLGRIGARDVATSARPGRGRDGLRVVARDHARADDRDPELAHGVTRQRRHRGTEITENVQRTILEIMRASARISAVPVRSVVQPLCVRSASSVRSVVARSDHRLEAAVPSGNPK